MAEFTSKKPNLRTKPTTTSLYQHIGSWAIGIEGEGVYASKLFFSQTTPYSQTTPSMRKLIFVKSEVADKNGFLNLLTRL